MFTSYESGFKLTSSQRIREEWPSLKRWCTKQQDMSKTSIKEMIHDARRDLIQRSRTASTNEKNQLNVEFEENTKSIPLQAQEGLVQLLRQEWEERLALFGLRPEDWDDRDDEEEADF